MTTFTALEFRAARDQPMPVLAYQVDQASGTTLVRHASFPSYSIAKDRAQQLLCEVNEYAYPRFILKLDFFEFALKQDLLRLQGPARLVPDLTGPIPFADALARWQGSKRDESDSDDSR